jgi:DNA modification methylase
MAVADQIVNDQYAIYNGDSCEVLPSLPDNSIHLSIYSPPFCGLFHYSSSERDLSNCRTYEEFFEHYEFIVREIHRVTLPGRITAVHCMDVPKDGANICGFIDFPGDVVRLHQRLGFEYLPRITIWNEPLDVRTRTMAKGLTHRQVVEDSTLTNVAASDYLIPFRKKGENPIPVVHPVGLTRYAGERDIPKELSKYRNYQGKQTENRYSHWIWRQYASGVWDDIRGKTGKRGVSGTLPFAPPDKDKDERHMHPLQLDVIERSVVMWSNPGETVLTPFMGVGSECYGAVVNARRAIGVELKESYFRQAAKNLANAANHAEKVENEESPVFALVGEE